MFLKRLVQALILSFFTLLLHAPGLDLERLSTVANFKFYIVALHNISCTYKMYEKYIILTVIINVIKDSVPIAIDIYCNFISTYCNNITKYNLK